MAGIDRKVARELAEPPERGAHLFGAAAVEVRPPAGAGKKRIAGEERAAAAQAAQAAGENAPEAEPKSTAKTAKKPAAKKTPVLRRMAVVVLPEPDGPVSATYGFFG